MDVLTAQVHKMEKELEGAIKDAEESKSEVGWHIDRAMIDSFRFFFSLLDIYYSIVS